MKLKTSIFIIFYVMLFIPLIQKDIHIFKVGHLTHIAALGS